jgi:hypothetical protein
LDVSEILDEIQDKTDDTSITDQDVIKWINRCQDILSAEFGPEITAIATIEKDVKEYVWFPDFLDVRKVELLDETGKFKRILEKTNYRILENEVGEPEYYYIRGRATGVYPYPSASGKKIKMYGKKRFPSVSDGEDIPELELNFHDIFVLYGCMRFYERDLDEMEGVAYYKNEFEQRVAELRRTQRKEPRRIKAGLWI